MRVMTRSRLAALMVFALAACGGAADPPAATSPDQPAVAQPSAAPAPAPQPAEPSLEFASLPAPYNAANYAAGKRTWKLCQSCHLTAEGAGNLVGPNLYGLFGRKVASEPGFAYSSALKAETFTWTPELLDQWLANPRGFVPGNQMSFSGVRKPEDRQAVIAFLMIQTGYEQPAPAQE